MTFDPNPVVCRQKDFSIDIQLTSAYDDIRISELCNIFTWGVPPEVTKADLSMFKQISVSQTLVVAGGAVDVVGGIVSIVGDVVAITKHPFADILATIGDTISAGGGILILAGDGMALDAANAEKEMHTIINNQYSKCKFLYTDYANGLYGCNQKLPLHLRSDAICHIRFGGPNLPPLIQELDDGGANFRYLMRYAVPVKKNVLLSYSEFVRISNLISDAFKILLTAKRTQDNKKINSFFNTTSHCLFSETTQSCKIVGSTPACGENSVNKAKLWPLSTSFNIPRFNLITNTYCPEDESMMTDSNNIFHLRGITIENSNSGLLDGTCKVSVITNSPSVNQFFRDENRSPKFVNCVSQNIVGNPIKPSKGGSFDTEETNYQIEEIAKAECKKVSSTENAALLSFQGRTCQSLPLIGDNGFLNKLAESLVDSGKFLVLGEAWEGNHQSMCG